jgi:hypothetical protein
MSNFFSSALDLPRLSKPLLAAPAWRTYHCLGLAGCARLGTTGRKLRRPEIARCGNHCVEASGYALRSNDGLGLSVMRHV